MNSTALWELPYPQSTDRPCAQDQLAALAHATDAALTIVGTRPWAQFNFRSQTQAPNNVALASLDLTAQSAHDSFGMANPQNIIAAEVGDVFKADINLRWDTPTPIGQAGGYNQLWLETPTATIAVDWLCRNFSHMRISIIGSLLFRYTGPTISLRLRSANDANVSATVNPSSQLWLTRVST